MKTVEGRTAFITGGASGIGLGIAKALEARGARIVIADLRPDHIEEALAGFAGGARSNSVSAIELDVANREAYADAAERMQADFGGIDILINNAGVGVEGPILEARYADWDFGLGVNLDGVVNGLTCFLPQMIAHGRGGHVVNTSSLAAAVTMPEAFVIYAAGKAAVLNMSENMREVLAEKGIGMSVLLPAFTKSKIHEARDNRPAHLREDSGFAASEKTLSEREIAEDWMEPEEVGEMVAKGILNDELYIVTHGQFANRMRDRFEAMMKATPHSDFQF